MATYNTTSDAYIATLIELLEHFQVKSSPRGKAIREILNYSFAVRDPSSTPIVTLDKERNEVIRDYLAKEFKLYDSGETSAEEFSKASKFWGQLANPDGTINSAYGHLIWFLADHGNTDFEGKMRTPWEWAKLCLTHDKDTRQAVLRFSRPNHQWDGNKDQVCTLHGCFMIRANKLFFSVVMRSSDAVRGLAYDLPWFAYIQEKMRQELLMTYNGLKLGELHFMAHSSHIYEDHTIVKAANMAYGPTSDWADHYHKTYGAF